MAGNGFSCDDYPLVSEREDEMAKGLVHYSTEGKIAECGQHLNSKIASSEYVELATCPKCIAKVIRIKLDVMNDFGLPIPRNLRTVLTKFFTRYPSYANGCVLRDGNHEGGSAIMCLIVESSMLYSALQGGYGWEAHTYWHDCFTGSGIFPEPANSCVICFYKD